MRDCDHNIGSLEERANYAISKIKENSIYFAHPVNYYVGGKFNVHGDKETELMQCLSKEFPEYNPYNPNQTYNQENYVFWKENTGSGMDYFYDVILSNMEAGVVLPFEDGMIGAGAFGEMEYLQTSRKPIWEINESGIITPIKELDYSRKLSVPDTQARVYPKK